MTIVPKTVLIFLSSIAGAFFVIFMFIACLQADLDALQANGVLMLWNVDAEVSIPTWFAQSLLIVAAGLLFLIAKSTRRDKPYWYILAGVMIFMSIDEGASIHELLITPMRGLLNIETGPLYYTWVVVYGLGLGVAGLFFLRFYARLGRKTRWLLAVALAAFLAGALGIEMLGGWIISQADLTWQFYAAVVGVEELFEMLGASLLIYTLLDFMSRRARTSTLHFADKSVLLAGNN